MSVNTPQHLQSADVGWLLKSMRAILRPVVQLCVGRITYSACADMLRELFIDEARVKLTSENKRITKAAMTLLTGIDSRTIDSVDQGQSISMTAGQLCPEANVLEQWANNPMFHDDEGRPRRLWPYGPGMTFSRLVTRAAGRGVSYSDVLDRLVEGGNVQVLEDQRIELLTTFYTPETWSQRRIFEAGAEAWNRLGRTINYNSARGPDDPPWLQQDRWTFRVRSEAVGELREQLRELALKQIEEAESLMGSYEKPVRTDDHATVGMGWYYWQSETETS